MRSSDSESSAGVTGRPGRSHSQAPSARRDRLSMLSASMASLSASSSDLRGGRPARAAPALCPHHRPPHVCHEPACPTLHLCRLFLDGFCPRDAADCRWGHDVTSAENRAALELHRLQGLPEPQLLWLARALLRQTAPVADEEYRRHLALCADYAADADCRRPDCFRVHLCPRLVSGQCRAGDDCRWSHRLASADNLMVLLRLRCAELAEAEVLARLARRAGREDDSDSETDSDSDTDSSVVDTGRPAAAPAGGAAAERPADWQTAAAAAEPVRRPEVAASADGGPGAARPEQTAAPAAARSDHGRAAAERAVPDVPPPAGAAAGATPAAAPAAAPCAPTPETMKRAAAKLDLCHSYLYPKKCFDGDCSGLHLCRFFVGGICPYGTNCVGGHRLLWNDNNKRLLRGHQLLSLPEEDMIAALRSGYLSRYPVTLEERLYVLQICRPYQIGKCKNKDCPRLHICDSFAREDCGMTGSSHPSHRLGSFANDSILKRVGLLSQREEDVLEMLKRPVSAMSMWNSVVRRGARDAPPDDAALLSAGQDPDVSGRDSGPSSSARAAPEPDGGPASRQEGSPSDELSLEVRQEGESTGERSLETAQGDSPTRKRSLYEGRQGGSPTVERCLDAVRQEEGPTGERSIDAARQEDGATGERAVDATQGSSPGDSARLADGAAGVRSVGPAQLVNGPSEAWSPRLCDRFSSEGRCGEADCDDFHVCGYFMANLCRRPADSCTLGHSFKTEHNLRVMGLHSLVGESPEAFQTLLDSMTLRARITFANGAHVKVQMCIPYNSGTGCTKSGDCGKFHICHRFLGGTCVDPDCQLDHGLTSAHNRRLRKALGVSAEPDAVWASDADLLELLRAKLGLRPGLRVGTAAAPAKTASAAPAEAAPAAPAKAVPVVSASVASSATGTVAAAPAEVTALPAVCRQHGSGAKCSASDCRAFHICPHFLAKFCRRQNCTLGHQLSTDHNRAALRLSGRLLTASNHQTLLKELYNASPHVRRTESYEKLRICISHNHTTGCASAQCTFIHICQKYVSGTCELQSCSLGHTLHTKANKKKLAALGLHDAPAHEVFEMIRAIHAVRSRAPA